MDRDVDAGELAVDDDVDDCGGGSVVDDRWLRRPIEAEDGGGAKARMVVAPAINRRREAIIRFIILVVFKYRISLRLMIMMINDQ
jgi:hypothetical protein